jgi:UDP-glucose 4-epimerase
MINVDVVFYEAAMVSVSSSIKSPEETHNANVTKIFGSARS